MSKERTITITEQEREILYFLLDNVSIKGTQPDAITIAQNCASLTVKLAPEVEPEMPIASAAKKSSARK